jgi:HEAT repeat protein
MSATWLIRHYLARRPGVAVLFAVLFSAGMSLADRFPPDPVEELRQGLRAFTPAPDLSQRILALRNLAEMRRALTLQDWRPEVAATEEPAVASRQKAQLLLAERFRQAVRQVLKQGTTDARLAVLGMLAEMGPSVTAPDPEDAKGIARTFAPDLVEIIKSGDLPSVKEAAARTLGQIFPDPEIAAPALREMLASPSVSERRAAASGLAGLMRTAGQLASKTGGAAGFQADRGDIVQAIRDVVPLAGRGLTDPDLDVRRSSADAVLQAASALANQIPQAGTGEEPFRVQPDVTSLTQARTALRPAMEVFQQQTRALGKGLSDPDLEVRRQLQQTLEDLGAARLRLLHGAEPNAVPDGTPPPAGTPGAALDRGQATLVALTFQRAAAPDLLLETLQELLPALERQLADPNVQIRLGAVDALEEYWRAALPAAPTLVRALADPDLFVRWAAARTLGKMGPVQITTAVPALARLLFDGDLDVRLAAATALERFGPAAESAVPELIRALRASDAVEREAVIRALEGIGTGAQPAIPGLVAALSDPEARVRQMAADLLGKFGSLAARAEPALRRALDDPDSEVRRAASDALLSIIQAQK